MSWQFWTMLIMWLLHDFSAVYFRAGGDKLVARSLSIEGSLFFIAMVYFA